MPKIPTFSFLSITRKQWIPLFFACLLVGSGFEVEGAQQKEEEKLFFKSFYGVKKDYERMVAKEQFHRIFFGETERNNTVLMQKASEKLYDALQKERNPKAPKGVKAWFEKLTKNHYAYLKEIVFPPKKFPFNFSARSGDSLQDQLLLRMFIFRLLRRIIQQEEWHRKPAVWKHRKKMDFKRMGRSIMDYHFPESNGWLGRMDENHEVLDPAVDEIVRRLKEQKLYIEISENTLDYFNQTKVYPQKGKNTCYILTKHIKDGDGNLANIASCDYRYTEETLTRKGSNTEFMMLQVIYFSKQKYADAFFYLPVSDFLLFNKGAKKIVERLREAQDDFTGPPVLKQIYQEQYRHLFNELHDAYIEISLIDDLLAEERDHSLRSLIGHNTKWRQRYKCFCDKYLELRIYIKMMKAIVKEKGGVNFKVGANHGFNHHKIIMDTLWSDEFFLDRLRTWSTNFQTDTERRYLFYRLQMMLDQGMVKNIKIHTKSMGMLEVEDIIEDEVLDEDAQVLLKVKDSREGSKVIPFAYTNPSSDMLSLETEIMSFEFEEEETSYRGKVAGLLTLSVGALLLHRWATKQSKEEEEKEKREKGMKK
ncbi:MAG: hypothetical protein AAF335_03845 [Bacteroidota bacterium]